MIFRILDLVNIHLFHDPSNLIALNSTPSIYSEYRRRALEYSIKKIKSHQVGSETSHLAVFGDFNFRLDLASLIDVNSQIYFRN
jgi:inositol-1,4,5-trisphosphate 5-phosphatase